MRAAGRAADAEGALSPIGVRPVSAASPSGVEPPTTRALTSREPSARKVMTSMMPPSPPGPSSGDAGASCTRISTMSVTGIELTS